MTIAVDLGFAALGNIDAAPSPAGDGGVSATGAELADLFQSLVDDLSKAGSSAAALPVDVPAGTGRPSKPCPPQTADPGVGSGDADDDTDSGDVSAPIGALLGLAPLPVPMDFTLAAETAHSKDAVVDAPVSAAPAATTEPADAAPARASGPPGVAVATEAPPPAAAASAVVSSPFVATDVVSTDVVSTDDISTDGVSTNVISTDVISRDAISTDVVNTDVVNTEVMNAEVIPTDSASTDVVPDQPALKADAAGNADADAVPSKGAVPDIPGRTDRLSMQQPGGAAKSDVPAPTLARSAAGRALARALGALVSDGRAEKPTAASTNAPVASTDQSQAPGAASIGKTQQPALTAASAMPALRPIATAQPDTYAFVPTTRGGDAPTNQQPPLPSGPTAAAVADPAGRSVQAAAPSVKAAFDLDVDANILKMRQSALAFQAPIRTEGLQVQAAQGGQQASIGIATPVVMVDRTDTGTVADQIVKAIRIQVRDGIGEVNLRLQPEHLGEVQIVLKVDRDRVTAVLQVERPEVRAQIESQGQTLRAGLAAQGLHLEELTVRTTENYAGQRGDGGQRGGQDTPQRRRRQSTTKQFELEES